MTVEQKKMIRDKAQAILDIAEARLRDASITDVNVHHDMTQIAGLARSFLEMVQPRPWPWE